MNPLAGTKTVYYSTLRTLYSVLSTRYPILSRRRVAQPRMTAGSTTSDPLFPASSFCLLTPPGRGAIATIAIRGNGSIPLVARLFHPASGKPLTDFPIGRTVFGRFKIPLPLGEGGERSEPGEGFQISENLVIGLIAPNEVEIHCHGGKAAAQA